MMAFPATSGDCSHHRRGGAIQDADGARKPRRGHHVARQAQARARTATAQGAGLHSQVTIQVENIFLNRNIRFCNHIIIL